MFRRLYLGIAIAALALSSCSTTPSPTASPTPTKRDISATLFFVGLNAKGYELYSEKHTITSTGDDALAAVTAVVESSVEPFDSDYMSFWDTAGGSLNSFVRSGNSATIDISVTDTATANNNGKQLVQQLLWTAFANDSNIKNIHITVDGKVQEKLGTKFAINEPFVRDSGYGVLSDIQIDKPVNNSAEKNPVIVTGMACTFEATVVWQLVKDDVIVTAGTTLATEACPTRSPFSIDLGTLDPGTYEVSAFELSEKDGSRVAEDSKVFNVS
jgi:hypothetical protein